MKHITSKSQRFEFLDSAVPGLMAYVIVHWFTSHTISREWRFTPYLGRFVSFYFSCQWVRLPTSSFIPPFLFHRLKACRSTSKQSNSLGDIFACNATPWLTSRFFRIWNLSVCRCFASQLFFRIYVAWYNTTVHNWEKYYFFISQYSWILPAGIAFFRSHVRCFRNWIFFWWTKLVFF